MNTYEQFLELSKSLQDANLPVGARAIRHAKLIKTTEGTMDTDVRLIKHEYFDDINAKENVYYTLQKYEPNLLGFNRKWRTQYTYGFYDTRYIVSGDAMWALDIAKHYGIEVPND